MKKIASFCVDHQKLDAGIYVSRIDGDIITLDLRMCKPYSGKLLTNIQMHSFEHLFATAMRNGAYSKNVIYIGPMGCQTGFYAVFVGLDESECVDAVKKGLSSVINYSGDMPGNSEYECGNNKTLCLKSGKEVANDYFDVIKDNTQPDKYLT